MSNAQRVNEALDVKLFNESLGHQPLILNKFTKKQIKELFIDDLIDSDGKATPRLNMLVREILRGNSHAY